MGGYESWASSPHQKPNACLPACQLVRVAVFADASAAKEAERAIPASTVQLPIHITASNPACLPGCVPAPLPVYPSLPACQLVRVAVFADGNAAEEAAAAGADVVGGEELIKALKDGEWVNDSGME